MKIYVRLLLYESLIPAENSALFFFFLFLIYKYLVIEQSEMVLQDNFKELPFSAIGYNCV